MTFRCSEGAAERGDPRLGTAPPQRDWLLVEHPGPWPMTAPFGADLPTPLLRELGHPDLRTLFVRAHGRDGLAGRPWPVGAVGSAATTASCAPATGPVPRTSSSALEPDAGTRTLSR